MRLVQKICRYTIEIPYKTLISNILIAVSIYGVYKSYTKEYKTG